MIDRIPVLQMVKHKLLLPWQQVLLVLYQIQSYVYVYLIRYCLHAFNPSKVHGTLIVILGPMSM